MHDQRMASDRGQLGRTALSEHIRNPIRRIVEITAQMTCAGICGTALNGMKSSAATGGYVKGFFGEARKVV